MKNFLVNVQILRTVHETSYVPSTNVQGSLSIQLRRRIRLNTPKSQCISEEGYSMLRCANKFVEQTIGCSSPWENFEVQIERGAVTKVPEK